MNMESDLKKFKRSESLDNKSRDHHLTSDDVSSFEEKRKLSLSDPSILENKASSSTASVGSGNDSGTIKKPRKFRPKKFIAKRLKSSPKESKSEDHDKSSEPENRAISPSNLASTISDRLRSPQAQVKKFKDNIAKKFSIKKRHRVGPESQSFDTELDESNLKKMSVLNESQTSLCEIEDPEEFMEEINKKPDEYEQIIVIQEKEGESNEVRRRSIEQAKFDEIPKRTQLKITISGKKVEKIVNEIQNKASSQIPIRSEGISFQSTNTTRTESKEKLANEPIAYQSASKTSSNLITLNNKNLAQDTKPTRMDSVKPISNANVGDEKENDAKDKPVILETIEKRQQSGEVEERPKSLDEKIIEAIKESQTNLQKLLLTSSLTASTSPSVGLSQILSEFENVKESNPKVEKTAETTQTEKPENLKKVVSFEEIEEESEEPKDIKSDKENFSETSVSEQFENLSVKSKEDSLTSNKDNPIIQVEDTSPSKPPKKGSFRSEFMKKFEKKPKRKDKKSSENKNVTKDREATVRTQEAREPYHVNFKSSSIDELREPKEDSRNTTPESPKITIRAEDIKFELGTPVRPLRTSSSNAAPPMRDMVSLESTGTNSRDNSMETGSQHSPLSELSEKSGSYRRKIAYVPQLTVYTPEEQELLKSTISNSEDLLDEKSVPPIEESLFPFPNCETPMDTMTSTSSPEKREHLYKILVIGELGTGKTSFIKRYVHQFFSQNYRATIGVDFALKVLNWDQNTTVRLQLWDIAGQERFGNMTRVYYKEAVGAFIVFDVTRSATFDAVIKWKQDLDSKVQLPDGSPIPCILLANKCDQQKQGSVTIPGKLDDYCKENGFAGWFETSAKDNINIEESAKALVSKILINDKLINSGEIFDNERFAIDGKNDNNGNSKYCSC